MSKYAKMNIPERRRTIDFINQHKDNGVWNDGTPQEAKDAEKDIHEYVKEQIRGKKSSKKDDGK